MAASSPSSELWPGAGRALLVIPGAALGVEAGAEALGEGPFASEGAWRGFVASHAQPSPSTSPASGITLQSAIRTAEV